MPNNEVVLVTGASSFVGAATILELLRKGYNVKATVRAQDKADAFIKKYPGAESYIEWAIVEDMVHPGAFDSAVQDVDFVIHVASPFFWAKPENNERDLLVPAVQGTKNVLEAAAKEPRITHVVITSSFAAIVDPSKGSNLGHTYTSDDWNPTTWEQALESASGPFVYCASKKFAESTAWQFFRNQRPHFSITTICPPEIYGPLYQPVESMDKLNQSAEDVWKIINGESSVLPPTSLPIFTDVRDIAQLQVAALTNPKSRNQRYLAVGSHYSNTQIAEIVAKAFPSQAFRIPPLDNSPPPSHFGTDSSKAERDFGIKWRTLEQSITDMARGLYGMEKELSS